MRPLRDIVEAEADEAAVQRTWRGIEARRERPRSWAPALALGAAVVVAIAIAIGVAVWMTRAERPGSLVLAGGAPLGDTITTTTELADGSRLLLAAGARIEVGENTGERMHLMLEAGKAEFRVTPGGPRRWNIDCGVATVEVVGTWFTIDRSAERVEVVVKEGHVRVASERLSPPVVHLYAGESVVVPVGKLAAAETETEAETGTATGTATGTGTGTGTATETETEAETETGTVAGTVAVAGSASGSGSGSVSASDSKRKLSPAPTTQPAPTRQSTTATKPSTATRPPATTVADLVQQADTARLAGKPADAVEPLRKAAAMDAPGAAVAGYSLGRLLLDQLGDPGAAAAAFEAAIKRGLPKSLDEPAHARVVEAHARAGHPDAATTWAAEYEARYPAGKSLDAVKKWAER